MLVDQMVESWEPSKYKDRYRDDLLARIQEKIAAGETEAVGGEADGEEEAEAGAGVVDIMSLLKRSVERVGKAREEQPVEEEEPEAKPSKGSGSGRKGRKTA